jgi:hypothetical protein
MHEKIALKKSIPSASEDLALALAEGTTDAASLVGLYPPDDKVRYLDEKKLWSFVTEDRFWETRAADNKPAHDRAAQRLTFMIECALSEDLLTLKDVADGMTFHEIATSLPVIELQEVVKHALQIARADAPLTEERLLAVVPLASLIEHVALEHTWHRVLVDKVAVECGWVEAAPSSAKPPSKKEETRATSSGPPALPRGRKETPPPPPPPPAPIQSTPESPAVADKAGSERPPEEDDARRKVIERLEAIDRLPPRHDALSSPILLSMESMYADLSSLTDDEDREACIHESFPNEQHLRQAMLALIELLDPSVNTDDPVIRDADVDGLIKLVLFEERRRNDPRKSQSMSSPGASPPSRRGGTRRSMPPPLPRGSSVPPPLPPDDPSRKRAN